MFLFLPTVPSYVPTHVVALLWRRLTFKALRSADNEITTSRAQQHAWSEQKSLLPDCETGPLVCFQCFGWTLEKNWGGGFPGPGRDSLRVSESSAISISMQWAMCVCPSSHPLGQTNNCLYPLSSSAPTWTQWLWLCGPLSQHHS